MSQVGIDWLKMTADLDILTQREIHAVEYAHTFFSQISWLKRL